MKVCLMIAASMALIAVALAEAPGAAPYPPSGWRPAKAFLLPVRAGRQDAYGPPRPVYGPPPTTTTAAPEPETTTAEAEETTTEVPTTTEATTETVTEEAQETEENNVESGRAADEEAESGPAGLYYILLPDGRLQRVLYTAGTPELGYNAQLRIADVEPVPPAPVYAYAGPLTRILRK